MGQVDPEINNVRASDKPGLGIEVNEDLARAHPYTGTDLHLEMAQEPCDYTRENVFEGGAPVKTS